MAIVSFDPDGAAPIDDIALARAIEQFLFDEAALLDAGRFEDWLALFAADGRYWVPGEPAAVDPDETLSIIDEDRALLAVRIDRLRRPRAYAAEPLPRTARLVGNVRCWSDGADGCLVRSTLMMAEYRDGTRRQFAAAVAHRLRRQGDGFRIALKRVELIDCDAVHEFMTVPF
jgi:benzoate/toluate 1,2-dioxygenase beta subunit